MKVDSQVDSAIGKLRAFLGESLSTSDKDRQEHATDVSHHEPQPPHAVVFPRQESDVVKIMRICAEHRCPVIPFGTGTAVEGGVVAIHGGICVDMSRMNRIVQVNDGSMDVTVEAGVTRKQLNQHLSDLGTDLYLPVDPGADASLGGMASTRASGTSAVRYGTMRESVLGLTAVLADGRLMKTGGRARKSSAGYDLTHLFVGSEGTLGIITELVLRLVHHPRSISAAVCAFSEIETAVQTVIEVISAGIPMARIELLDEVQMQAINSYSNMHYKLAPTLFFEFHGSESAVIEQAKEVQNIVAARGGEEFQWATDKDEREKLWQARYDGYYATLALRPGSTGYVTDVCVPISELAECIRRTRVDLQTTSIPAPLYGHVGDGNFHVVFPIDPTSAEELAEVQELSKRIVNHALELGGTCSGEHGIGIGKVDALERQYPVAIGVMRQIKQALDPDNIMNPGKVLRV